MPTRRKFITAAAGIAGGVIASDGWIALARVAAADTSPSGNLVRLTADIEPVVRLIETTPREKCFEVIADRIAAGLTYRQFLAALYLAGIRNVNPQPPGFKFHCVFVMHAAHQFSLDAPREDQLLPLFWALDEFKQSQERDVREGDFQLQPVRGTLPDAGPAWSEFNAAMDDWDEARADRAIAVLARSRGALEIQENLWRFGARDYRNIGHKAVFVANTWRTLQTIGWRHAEPALRSLVLGLLDFGKTERVNDHTMDDQCYYDNVTLVEQHLGKLPGDWTVPGANESATHDLLDAIRSGEVSQSCQTVLQSLVEGKASAHAAWDAVHLAAGELMMQQQGIYGIHTVTSVNGLRYGYEMSGSPKTRLLMLLQAVGWLGQFRNFMAGKSQGLKSVKITDLTPGQIDDPTSAPQEILSLVQSDVSAAARKAFAFGDSKLALPNFQRAALHQIFRKANEPHYYKYPSAIFEDFRRVSKPFRPHVLAAGTYYVPGSTLPDSPIMQHALEVVSRLNTAGKAIP